MFGVVVNLTCDDMAQPRNLQLSSEGLTDEK